MPIKVTSRNGSLIVVNPLCFVCISQGVDNSCLVLRDCTVYIRETPEQFFNLLLESQNES